MNQISQQLDSREYKYYAPQTLFPLNWEALNESKCPLYLKKLIIPLKGKMAFCNRTHKIFLIDKKKI